MQEELLLMSSRERERKAIVEAVKQGHFTVKEAAKRMGVTPRQARRILRCYEQLGDRGLIHGHRGKPSNHQLKASLKQAVLGLYQTKYIGFGPTLAVEKLELEGYTLSAETLRLWLKKAGLWDKKRQRDPYRKRREPRACFGELLQMDGSFHHWFGESQPTACLMNLVDDATGTTLSLIDKEETTEAAMRLLMKWIERYGIPKAIYVDLKTVYVSPKTYKHTEEDEITQAFTHFSKACDKLGMEVIKAYSPQAKGRVERKHAVFQDRFVKELALQNMTTIANANKLLEKGFVDDLNCKFARTPKSLDNAHRPSPKKHELHQIFCWEYQRKVQNDWVVQFQTKYYQLDKSLAGHVKPKQAVIVRQHLDGSVSLWRGNQQLDYQIIAHRDKPKPFLKKGYDTYAMGQRARQNKHKSPWSKFNPSWIKPGKQSGNFRQNTL